MTQFPVQSQGGQTVVSDPQSHRGRDDARHGWCVEANLTSGALIHGGQAIDNGRQLFAVPAGSIRREAKAATTLIKKGAKLCEGAEDILSEF